MQYGGSQGSRHLSRSRCQVGGYEAMQVGILFDKLSVDIYALT
jgi:hypothetical protein